MRVQSLSSLLPEPLVSFARPVLGLSGSPVAAALMAARRCLALSSPWSAALTYQTLASRGSRLQPIPISVKYPMAYSAFARPALHVKAKTGNHRVRYAPSSAAFLAHSYASFSSLARKGSAPTMYHAQSAIMASGCPCWAAPL